MNLRPPFRYHHGSRWTSLYRHVVGVTHTNYLQYARLDDKGVPGFIKEPWCAAMNQV